MKYMNILEIQTVFITAHLFQVMRCLDVFLKAYLIYIEVDQLPSAVVGSRRNVINFQ